MSNRLNPSWVFSTLAATMSAGYGVLFTLVGDFRDQYGISESAIGVVIGSGFLAAFVAQIFIAPIADRGLARHLIVFGVTANVVGMLMIGFGESLTPILAGRVISGIGIGAALPAIKRIVILADAENLGQNLGRLFSAEVFGFAVGPAVSAGLAEPLGLAAPFVVVVAASGLVLPLTFFVRTEDSGQDVPKQRLALDLLRSRAVAGAVVLGAAVFLMIGTFDALWDLVHEDLDTPTWMANLGITLFAVPLVVLGPTGGRLAQRVGPFRIAALGLAMGAFFTFIYGQVPTGTWIFSLSLFHAVNDGLTFAASSIALAMSVPEERQAGAQGVMGAAQALVAGITAIIVGSLYQGTGRAVAYGAGALGMVILMIIGLALAAEFWRTRSHEAAAMPEAAIESPATW